MSDLYHLILRSVDQAPVGECFVGGTPKLPPGEGIPKCSLCGNAQTFFFQIGFPVTHVWGGLSLVVFSCTSCADENHLIPEMLPGTLAGADVPSDFLARYQRSFRFMVFQTTSGQMVSSYKERIQYRPIELGDADEGVSIGHVGGAPKWILEDEGPSTCDSTVGMRFLFQVNPGIAFATVDGAPPQMEVGLTGRPEPSPFQSYQLFIGNAVYFFGTDDRAQRLVYALTQVD